MCLRGLPTLISVTICANAERENGTNIFLFLSRMFLFSKGITIIFFYISVILTLINYKKNSTAKTRLE